MYFINKKDGSIAEIIDEYEQWGEVMLQIGRSVQKVVKRSELESEWEQREGNRP